MMVMLLHGRDDGLVDGTNHGYGDTIHRRIDDFAPRETAIAVWARRCGDSRLQPPVTNTGQIGADTKRYDESRVLIERGDGLVIFISGTKLIYATTISHDDNHRKLFL